MLAPETLSKIAGVDITTVRETALGGTASAFSGSGLMSVEAQLAAGGTRRFVLKRTSPAWDYFMRATGDMAGREAVLWTSGLLDRMPPELGHPVVAAAVDGDDAWAVLMRDIAGDLILSRGRIEHDEHVAILRGLAAMHATFWDAPELVYPALGLAQPAMHYHLISPASATRHADVPGPMPAYIHQGWDSLARILPRDLYDTLLALTNDPSPLVAALERFPMTLVHGDARIANIGLERGADGEPRAVLIDWAIAGRNAACLDLIWYLSARTHWLPGDRDAAIALYRDELRSRLGDRFDDAWWEPMLELSILGGLIRFGWFTASEALRGAGASSDEARSDLLWWAERAWAGVELLDHS